MIQATGLFKASQIPICRQGWEPLPYGTDLFAKVKRFERSTQKEAMHDKEMGILFDNKDYIVL